MEDDIIEKLKDHLSISVSIEHGWYNEKTLKVQLLWDHDVISESTQYLPDHNCEKDSW